MQKVNNNGIASLNMAIVRENNKTNINNTQGSQLVILIIMNKMKTSS